MSKFINFVTWLTPRRYSAAYHFEKEGHTEDDMEVVVLEEVQGKDDLYRTTRERYWINATHTVWRLKFCCR